VVETYAWFIVIGHQLLCAIRRLMLTDVGYEDDDDMTLYQLRQDSMPLCQLRRELQQCQQAVILVVDAFYLQRPPYPNVNKELFSVVRVKKILYDGLRQQWGAWVQLWQLATVGDLNACYYGDPWWASAAMPDGQRYYPSPCARELQWTYCVSPLSDFQAEVQMTKKWIKPAGWGKEFVGGHHGAYGVVKRNLTKVAISSIVAVVKRFSTEA
jgi:hypothetical protein